MDETEGTKKKKESDSIESRSFQEACHDRRKYRLECPYYGNQLFYATPTTTAQSNVPVHDGSPPGYIATTQLQEHFKHAAGSFMGVQAARTSYSRALAARSADHENVTRDGTCPEPARPSGGPEGVGKLLRATA